MLCQHRFIDLELLRVFSIHDQLVGFNFLNSLLILCRLSIVLFGHGFDLNQFILERLYFCDVLIFQHTQLLVVAALDAMHLIDGVLSGQFELVFGILLQFLHLFFLKFKELALLVLSVRVIELLMNICHLYEEFFLR